MDIKLPEELHLQVVDSVHNAYAHKAGLLRTEYVLHFIQDDDERLLYKTEAGKRIHIAINAHPLFHPQRFLAICKSVFHKNSMLKDLLIRQTLVKQTDAIKWWGIDVIEGSIPHQHEIESVELHAKLTIFTKIVAVDPKTKTSVEATFQGSAFDATPRVLRLLRDKINSRVFMSEEEQDEGEEDDAKLEAKDIYASVIIDLTGEVVND